MKEVIILPIILAFVLSVLLSIIIIKFVNFGIDQSKGIQKIHQKAASRLGSIPIFFSALLPYFIFDSLSSKVVLFFLALTPLYISGLLEDLLNSISPNIRLGCALISSSLIVLITNTYLGQVDIVWANTLLEISIISFIFTTIGITATSNAWNIIDGLHGFSSGLAIIVLSVICYLSWIEKLDDIFMICLYIISSTLGFFLVNILTGRIFLGDAGSYGLGAIIAWSGLVITSNNSKTSSWVIFFIIIYPATELLISFFRRIKNKKSPFLADNEHLHSILHNNILNRYVKTSRYQINLSASLIVLILASTPSLLIIFFDIKYPYILYAIVIYVFIFLILKKFLINSKMNKNTKIENKINKLKDNE
tara:strand:- start:205 stop:1296 length:1092 start_codon:yes stop_codon:yes gene_type:complete